MIGISLYLHEAPAEEALRRLSDAGFQTIFTSLHIPEVDVSAYRSRLQQLGAIAKSLSMEVMADISTHSLANLGLTWREAPELLKWGVTGLRIDYGIETETIVSLSQQMKLALNASTLDKEAMHRLNQQGLCAEQIEVWHNFYPRPETGLGLEDFLDKNALFYSLGYQVQAFIPGDTQLRGPLYKSLPTLEKHRMMGTFASYKDMKQYGVQKIVVGDSGVSDQALRQFTAYQNGTILLRAKAFAENEKAKAFLTAVNHNRMDAARDVIRSEESRLSGTFSQIAVAPEQTAERPLGTITIDNDRYQRYKGEIQITKTDLPADEKVNVLGKVIAEDIPLLKHMKAGTAFSIEWV